MSPVVRRHRRCRRSRGERGSMAVEVVLMAPVLMAFVILIVMFGRYVAVRGDVDAMARDAARAASLQQSPSAALAAAKDVVRDSTDSQTTCSSVRMSGPWEAGGEVTITLDCSVSFDGLGLIGVPGRKGVSGSSTAPLDPYRDFS